MPGSSAFADSEIAPLLDWIARRRAALVRPLVVGIAGAQGSGKSTLATRLQVMLQTSNPVSLRTIVVSIDDLYLPQSERESLAARVHPLLRTRGVPGTHDVKLGLDRLARLTAGEPVRLPRFDKASDDRLPASSWPCAEGAADVILFEGWCVGCPPEPPAALRLPVNALERNEDPDGTWRRFVQEQLEGPYRSLFAPLDALVFLRVPSFAAAFRWRLQQERERASASLSSTSRPPMDEAALERFMQHYERLTRHMLQVLPSTADVTISLAKDHSVDRLGFKA